LIDLSRQQEIENRDRLALRAAATDRDDLVSAVEIDTFERTGIRDLRGKRNGQVLL
jgi:hypothetical protein